MEGVHRQALGRADLLILLQEFAQYYLAKKLSQAPAQELETKAELLQAGKSPGPCGRCGRDTEEVQVRSPGKWPHVCEPCVSRRRPGKEAVPTTLWLFPLEQNGETAASSLDPESLSPKPWADLNCCILHFFFIVAGFCFLFFCLFVFGNRVFLWGPRLRLRNLPTSASWVQSLKAIPSCLA